MKKFLVIAIVSIVVAVAGIYYYIYSPSDNTLVTQDAITQLKNLEKVKRREAFKSSPGKQENQVSGSASQDYFLPELSEDCLAQLEKRKSALQLEVSESVFLPLSSSCKESLVKNFGVTEQEADQIMSTCNGASIIKRAEKLLTLIPGQKKKLDTEMFKDKKCQFALINHFREFVDYYVTHRNDILEFGNKLYIVLYEEGTSRLQTTPQDDGAAEFQKALLRKVLQESTPFIYEISHTLMRSLLINAFDENRINRDKQFVTVLEHYKEYAEFEKKYEAIMKSEKYQKMINP